MCSGSEAGSYVRLIDFVYHSTLGWRVIKKKKKYVPRGLRPESPKTRIEGCVQKWTGQLSGFANAIWTAFV